MPQQTNNLTGATSEYFVCAELGKQGNKVSLKAGSASKCANPLQQLLCFS